MVDASRTRVSFSSAKFICRSICSRSMVSRSFFALMLSAISRRHRCTTSASQHQRALRSRARRREEGARFSHRAIFSSKCFTLSSHGSLDDSDLAPGASLPSSLLPSTALRASSSSAGSSTSCGGQPHAHLSVPRGGARSTPKPYSNPTPHLVSHWARVLSSVRPLSPQHARRVWQVRMLRHTHRPSATQRRTLLGSEV